MKKNDILKVSFGIILFLIILILVVFKSTSAFDSTIYNFIISFRHPFLDAYFKIITLLGNPNMVIIILGFLILLFRDKKALILTINVFSSVSINSIIKHIIRRKRPTVKHLIKQGGFSFPSGHAMISICLYGYLLYLVQKEVKNKVIKNILTIILTLIIISIGLSRIYLGVHFATDIIAGYCLALSLLTIIIYYTNKYLKGV